MLGHYPTDIIISLSVFAIALWIILLFRTNIIIMVFGLELLLLSNILGFIISSIYLNDVIGEIFSIFILAVAAIETAIALSILLSYYKITNKNIDTTKQYSEEFLSALVLTLGNSEYTVLSWHGFCVFLCVVFCSYIWIWGPATYVIPGCIWLLYRFKYNFYCVELGYMHLPTKVFKYLMRPESQKLNEWLHYGYARQERERYFWGVVWSVITFEFLPKRSNDLNTLHWNAFSFPEYDIEGWRLFHFEIFPFSWYLRFVAKYTLSGQRFFELRKIHDQIHNQIIKDHKKECKKYEDEIERLQDIIRVKDAYLEMYQRDLGGRR